MQNVTYNIVIRTLPLMILRIEKHSKSEWCYLCTVGSSKGFAYCQLGMWDSATLTETTLAVPSTLPQCIHNTYY